ncbi:LacI family DNA-binding transcriptional regulator [Kineococcus rhizosphaerae]|uniref:LacI family DNA-binding transcriptional regulator n=1 Tax=Kineococcus rhizosphaerae TaxID=559628 RepID=UPI000D06E358|nr:LacI family DNA-binding transcriptional regulator [Kineococcus rhizosphaerae]
MNTSGPRPAALADVAAAAGVHPSTASRALGAGTGISARTVERVRAVAAELGYRPDPAASSLRTRRSGLIGVLVPRLTDIVLATIYEGLDATAAEAGYQTFVANTSDDPEVRRRRLAALLDRRVDGLVLGDARLEDDLLPEISARGLPYVLVSRRSRGHLSVTTDDLAGGRLAARHLLQLGHRHVGVVAGQPFSSTGVERTQGFRAEFAAAGHPVPDDLVVRGPYDVPSGHAAALRLLAARPRPTAIFAVNDFNAIGVMGALRETGLQVGRDVAVVGYNDVSIAAELPVPLTTVRSAMVEMGRQGMSRLLARAAGSPVRSLRLRPELVARESSGTHRR